MCGWHHRVLNRTLLLIDPLAILQGMSVPDILRKTLPIELGTNGSPFAVKKMWVTPCIGVCKPFAHVRVLT